MQSIAIFGGTFDPVHNGHIKTSEAIQKYFNFDSYYFLPCKTPTLKSPTTANTEQRIAMLELAIKNSRSFKIDLREIKRDTPSFMSETLASFRAEYEKASITLILGYDAFLSLSQWHQWKQIIQLANLLVINRNTFATSAVPKAIKDLLSKHKSNEKMALLASQSGVIYEFDAGDYDISSTRIREQLKLHQNIETVLPKEVYDYINLWQLYQ